MSKTPATKPGNNQRGHNQHTWSDPYNPLTLRKAKALVMLEQGATTREIQAITGLSKQTITNCRKGLYEVPRNMINALRASEADKFTFAAHRILDTIIDPEASGEVIEKATLVQRATATGILYDKARLARGEPTSIDEQRLRAMTDEEIKVQLTRLRKELDELGWGEILDAEFEPME